MFVTETKLSVRYVETDKMGIVHHSNYAVWFEAARTDFTKRLGFSYARVESMGLNMPLTELGCKYFGSATYDDDITIVTRIKSLTVARVEFGYTVFKASSDQPINEGYTILAFTDANLKPINVKKKLPELYNLMSNAMAEENING